MGKQAAIDGRFSLVNTAIQASCYQFVGDLKAVAGRSEAVALGALQTVDIGELILIATSALDPPAAGAWEITHHPTLP